MVVLCAYSTPVKKVLGSTCARTLYALRHFITRPSHSTASAKQEYSTCQSSQSCLPEQVRDVRVNLAVSIELLRYAMRAASSRLFRAASISETKTITNQSQPPHTHSQSSLALDTTNLHQLSKRAREALSGQLHVPVHNGEPKATSICQMRRIIEPHCRTSHLTATMHCNTEISTTAT